MQKSDILGLNLPDQDDMYNVDDFNANFKILDGEGEKTGKNSEDIVALQLAIKNQASTITTLQKTIQSIAQSLGDFSKIADMLYTRNVSTILTDQDGDSILTRSGDEIELYFTLQAE